MAGDSRRQTETPDRLLTVAQLGYLFLIFPLLTNPTALKAGVMQIFAHGLAKAGMFAAAGVMIKATGQDTVAGFGRRGRASAGDVVRFRPRRHDADGPAAFLGVSRQVADHRAALAQGYWIIAVVALAGGLLAAVYVFRVLRQAFMLAPEGRAVAAVPRALEWSALPWLPRAFYLDFGV